MVTSFNKVSSTGQNGCSSLPNRSLHIFAVGALASLCLLSLASSLHADTPNPKKGEQKSDVRPAAKPKSDKWSFSFLPIGMQRNPQVEFTIITEMTDEGRKLPEPSFAKPVYYISHSVGQRDVGDSYAGTKTIEYKYLEKQLNRALASNGFREADIDHPATQLLFIAWGMHNSITLPETVAGDGDDSVEFVAYNVDTDMVSNLLSRAKTIGGKKFADEFARAVYEQKNWNGRLSADARGPISDFAQRDELTEALVYQVFEECYYLLVTSFDVDALKTGQKKILWTTKISTSSKGIPFEGTLPNMIDNGAYYFGRDMALPDIIRKRALKKATVDIGEATVQEYYMSGTSIPAPSGTAKPATTPSQPTGTTSPAAK